MLRLKISINIFVILRKQLRSKIYVMLRNELNYFRRDDIMRKRFTRIFALALGLVVLLLIASCTAPFLETDITVKTSSTNTATETQLMAGQNIVAGTVKVSNDGTNLYVEISTTNGWLMGSAAVAIADSTQTLISKNGYGNGNNLVPGKFPYKQTFNPYITYYKFTIPLGSWKPGDTVYIAVHTDLYLPREDGSYQNETGWAKGTNIGKNWAMYFVYVIQEPPQEPTYSYGPGETAWAKGTHNFMKEVGQGKVVQEGWGWYFMVDKTQSATQLDLVIKTGPGSSDNDFTKVGTVNVYISTGSVNVTTNHPDWVMSELHVYYGSSIPGSAPGQYPLKYEYSYFNTHTFTFDITSLPDSFYMAVHAVVHEKF